MSITPNVPLVRQCIVMDADLLQFPRSKEKQVHGEGFYLLPGLEFMDPGRNNAQFDATTCVTDPFDDERITRPPMKQNTSSSL